MNCPGECFRGRPRLADELGAALNGRQLRVRAYKIMDENGLRRVRLYDARASCLTYLADNGVPDHLLAMWAGHTNVKTTRKWYVKPDVVDLLPAAEAWGGLAGGVGQIVTDEGVNP
ncbi:tyrosine-type recombinase/integrase [Streptomyces sp. NPDC058299]|uniref:tyrosine-type recombinase/integrase n=1 Tax=unclassified Streptomyces TaxID=2593676 RepID=UPI0036E91331